MNYILYNLNILVKILDSHLIKYLLIYMEIYYYYSKVNLMVT